MRPSVADAAQGGVPFCKNEWWPDLVEPGLGRPMPDGV